MVAWLRGSRIVGAVFGIGVMFALTPPALADDRCSDAAAGECDAAHDLYDATKNNPVVDFIERTVTGGRDTTMDQDQREAEQSQPDSTDDGGN